RVVRRREVEVSTCFRRRAGERDVDLPTDHEKYRTAPPQGRGRHPVRCVGPWSQSEILRIPTVISCPPGHRPRRRRRTVEALDLARWQFGITTVYHFILVPLTIGLSTLVAIMHTAWVRTGRQEWHRLTKFFGKLL